MHYGDSALKRVLAHCIFVDFKIYSCYVKFSTVFHKKRGRHSTLSDRQNKASSHRHFWQILQLGHCQPARTMGFMSTGGSRQLPPT